MNILHIMPYSPVPPVFGGALRVYHLLTMMSRNHNVTAIVFGMEDGLAEFKKEFGSRLAGIHFVPFRWTRTYRRYAQLLSFASSKSFMHSIVYSKQMQETISRVLVTGSFDLIQTEFATMGCYSLPDGIPKILDSHNVEYDNFRRIWLKSRSPLRRLHYYDEYKKYYHEELANYSKQDALFVTSERDKQILDEELPLLPKYVIPNGVDAAYFIPSEQTPEPYSLVFTGAMSYVPNYDGMLYFLDDIFPLIQKELPQSRVYIVGGGPPRELSRRANEHIVVTGYVDDVRPYVYRSSAIIVPLRMGGGTRLKVLEAMAMKKPIVSTSIGCEGIDVTHHESILIADEPAAFAQQTIQLLRDADTRNKLVSNAYALMQSRYEWNVIGKQIEELYAHICHNHKHEPIIA
jgi:glycosyltransferase involved in cell wall biosynthesis